MRVFYKMIVVLALLWPAAARADEAAVRDVIALQIGALQRDDFDEAFSYASPLIQDIFETPENFGTMVRRGYPMVWRPSALRFALIRQDGDVFYQQVVLGHGTDDSVVAEYEVVQIDGAWRINGVQLLRDAGAGA
ncbi:protein of unknown function [Monaibacterium marinum]|uniref:DUF4864 domain-containing protein n=1 Tax=Pontivivens marinum TaxID=1690039 RepID=A0A2C9CNS2_9RHOB|nr:DUF4864 domain-containing protein [Monaibacterium marinum]SOH92858.1 protein of unknown function [Monaibacterium marinum]